MKECIAKDSIREEEIELNIFKSKWTRLLILLAIILISNILIFKVITINTNDILKIKIEVKADHTDNYQMFYVLQGEDWTEEQSMSMTYTKENSMQELVYTVPKDVKKLRLDVGQNIGDITLENVKIGQNKEYIDLESYIIPEFKNDIDKLQINERSILIHSKGQDPFIVFDITQMDKSVFRSNKNINLFLKILICIILDLIIVGINSKRNTITSLTHELYNNKNLIWNLSKNDFKTKYAGSYLGITWAFVQPVVTVLVYWFVFQVGFRSVPIQNVPYILWLVAGIVPWFFFNEAILNSMNSMLEYSYLVKKVVFKISILPIVKIISSLFVHLFFVAFTLLLFVLYGFMPHIYMLQALYYTICTFALVLALAYSTCAIVIFFRDLGQIVGIFLQVGMWMTPIMWAYTMVPERFQWVLKINPMYYIVEGYRDSFINKVWFWERYNQTIYFWAITAGLFIIGTVIFKKLKVHFADVL